MERLLSAVEVAGLLGISVKEVYNLQRAGVLKPQITSSGQYKYKINEVLKIKEQSFLISNTADQQELNQQNTIYVNGTCQTVILSDARNMKEIADSSIHLVITSPPYFNAKSYSLIENDLGNIPDLDRWFEEIGKVWQETFRVLQPGRKAFINIMNLPVKTKQGFKSLNLFGRTIDLCEKIGFIFRREIIWHKTNSVKAHFGTYPYPGGILLNFAHEFIIEFEKPAPKNFPKYKHLTQEQKENSKIDKEFWIEIKKSDVWLMKPELSGVNREHPAPFPYELPYRLIKAFSFIGETILDPFLGSGTTLVAARDLKRNGIGYEINPEIAKIAIKRIQNQ